MNVARFYFAVVFALAVLLGFVPARAANAFPEVPEKHTERPERAEKETVFSNCFLAEPSWNVPRAYASGEPRLVLTTLTSR